jgi:hypothetical protein
MMTLADFGNVYMEWGTCSFISVGEHIHTLINHWFAYFIGLLCHWSIMMVTIWIQNIIMVPWMVAQYITLVILCVIEIGGDIIEHLTGIQRNKQREGVDATFNT